MNWDWSFAERILPVVLGGLRTTLIATLFGTAIALIIGMTFSLTARSGSKALRLVSRSISEFIRRTPLLVQIYFIYFILPTWGLTLPGLFCGILALGLHAGAYLSEVYRAGIAGVQPGQWEACVALNFAQRDKWIKIILPQAIPPMIPAIGNYVILMFKDTALLSVIGVPELMTMARSIGNDTYRYLEPLSLVALIYLVLSLCAALVLRQLERRSGAHRLVA